MSQIQSLPVKTLHELVPRAKREPGRLRRRYSRNLATKHSPFLACLYTLFETAAFFPSKAQKGIAALEPDAGMAAQVMIMQKVISQNGVPAMEIGRVLADGADSKELFNHLADAAGTTFNRKTFSLSIVVETGLRFLLAPVTCVNYPFWSILV